MADTIALLGGACERWWQPAVHDRLRRRKAGGYLRAKMAAYTEMALVNPPVALALDVGALSLSEIGCPDDEDL